MTSTNLAPDGSKLLGNTKPRANAALKWCFTLNNYSEQELTDTETWCGSNGSYVFGKEIGESGTPHLQGYIKLKKKGRPMEMMTNKRFHWEICKGSEEANWEYCTKEGSWVSNMTPPKIKKPLKILDDSKLYKWEKDILKIISTEPDDRTIHWYWEPIGKSGKSTFTKFLCAKYNAVPVEGKKADILFCCAEFESDLYIFDFERSMENFISYAAMEKIKNGCYMCSKYESKPIVRNSPHIICFANFPPDKTKLSTDRWNIVELQSPQPEDLTPEEIDKMLGDYLTV